MAQELFKSVVIPDIHFPYQHDRILKIVERFLEEEQPGEVVLLGDLMDFGEVSRFEQDPRHAVDLQTQLTIAKEWLFNLRRILPKSHIVLLEGNHETRLYKYMVRRADKLLWLTTPDGTEPLISLPYLLGLEGLNIQWVDSGSQPCPWGSGQVICHGDRASSYSAYTAKRMLDAYRTSGVSGHTHRLGAYWYTGFYGPERWLEAGYLGDPDSEGFRYAVTKNWQHGLVIRENDGVEGLDAVKQVSLVEISKDGFIWSGKRFK